MIEIYSIIVSNTRTGKIYDAVELDYLYVLSMIIKIDNGRHR